MILQPAGQFTEILFFLKKRFPQLFILLFCTYLAAHGFKGSGHRKAFPHILTRIRLAFCTGFNASFFTACNHMIPTPVFRLASRAGDFIPGDNMVSVTNLHPQFCCMPQFSLCFLIWMCCISGACSAVISAGCYDSVHTSTSYVIKTYISIADYGWPCFALQPWYHHYTQIHLKYNTAKNADPKFPIPVSGCTGQLHIARVRCSGYNQVNKI